MSSSSSDDLRLYYEEEARQRLRKPVQGRRVDLRTRFVEQLNAEGRLSVVDFGAGPGHEASAFHQVGIGYVGLDIAHGNGVLAAGDGATVVQGSVAAPPFRHDGFEAGWSMSTLMHLPTPSVPAAVEAIAAVLVEGAPLWVGQWGGDLGDVFEGDAVPGQRRLFSLRSAELNRSLLAEVGEVEHQETWSVGPEGWEYHVIQVRVHKQVA